MEKYKRSTYIRNSREFEKLTEKARHGDKSRTYERDGEKCTKSNSKGERTGGTLR